MRPNLKSQPDAGSLRTVVLGYSFGRGAWPDWGLVEEVHAR